MEKITPAICVICISVMALLIYEHDEQSKHYHDLWKSCEATK